MILSEFHITSQSGDWHPLRRSQRQRRTIIFFNYGRLRTTGGYKNTINCCSSFSSIDSGGCNCIVNAFASFIGSGANNCIVHTAGAFYCMSSVVGGCLNTVENNFATIIGGCHNSITGEYSVILGGCGNTVSHNYAAAFGKGVSSAAANTFHVECLNAVNTACYNPLFPPGTIAYITCGTAIPSGAKALYIL